MADITFNTTAGQTVDRELLVAYLNTSATSTPVWSPLGKRVSDSSMEYDFSADTTRDIWGQSYTTLRKPNVTQSFDPYPLDGGDTALVKIWNLAVKDQNVAALSAQDVLVVHLYAGTADTAMFAERYQSSAISVTSNGGEGGGTANMAVDIAYGGLRTTGTASITTSGVVTFTAA